MDEQRQARSGGGSMYHGLAGQRNGEASYATSCNGKVLRSKGGTVKIDAVSRQDVIKICRKYNGKGYVWAAIACRVRQLPAIRPDTAEWIRIGKTGRNYECSACGAFLNMGRFNAGRGSAKYCPNCGARMEEANG